MLYFASMELTIYLSSPRHEYLKVSYNSIAALGKSEGTATGSY